MLVDGDDDGDDGRVGIAHDGVHHDPIGCGGCDWLLLIGRRRGQAALSVHWIGRSLLHGCS